MIVIGDCHGCYNELMELVDVLPKDSKLCFVGDLIDRGPDSKKVLEFVRDNKHECVIGNHEEMAYRDHNLWSINGQMSTLKSFINHDVDDGVWDWYKDSMRNMKEDGWFDWFQSLPWSIECQRKDGQKFLISHSYAQDGLDTMEYNLLWDRKLLEKPTKNLDSYINIFGHTPHKQATQYHDKHWCIDTGCFHTGILTGIDLNTMKIYSTKGKHKGEISESN